MAKTKHKTQPSKRPLARLNPLHYVLLLLVPFLVYGRVLFNDFVMHDDDKMILENPMVKQGVNPAIAFTTDAWFMDARIELYRPWQSITYMIDYALGKENPFIYHLHNLLVFLAGAFLALIFLRYYFRPMVAWAGAILYSVNLLAPHAVGWIAARGDLYLMVFGLGFLILLQRYLSTKSKVSLWLALPLFGLALLSKESAIALLPVAAVMLYVERQKMPSGAEWAWLLINVVLFAGYFMIRKEAIADAGNFSAAAFISNLRSLPEELFKMVLPLGFSVMPGYKVLWTAAGTVLAGMLVYLLLKSRPPRRIVWAGLAITLFSLLPSMVYEPSFAGVAYDYLDHRAWFPFIGIWMLVLGWVEQRHLDQQKMATYVFSGVLVVWSCVNLWRVGTYHDWQSYYTNAIQTNPGSGLANLNYGSMLRDQGRWEEALPYVEKGVQLSPNYTDAKVRLSEVYYNLKRYKESVDMADQALVAEPQNISALQFKGSALGASGQPLPAAEVFKKILEIQPDNAHGLFNLGIAYKDANQTNQAIETLSKLIVLKPDFPNAYFERGFCYGKLGLFPQAKADMEESIKIQPEHGPSYFFRGRTEDALGNPQAACADWKKAVELGVKEAEDFVKNRCQ